MCFNQNSPSSPHDFDVDMGDADFIASLGEDMLTQTMGDELVLDTLHLFSANVKISGHRVKCLFDEILRRDSDSQPLIVAVQDLSRKQAFTRLPGYNFWAADLGLITEDDYELSTREASQVKSIELARHAICAASISLDKVSDAMQDFSDAPPEIEEALFDIVQSLSSSRDALVVTHDTFAEARGTLSVAIQRVEDAQEVISKAQDAVPQIQGILFAALDELLGPLRVLSGVQRSFSCEEDAAARPQEERIRGVGFYVHSSLRTDQWRVRSYPGDNEDIFATLELTTLSGLLAIHNAYNHNNRLDVPALLQHLASYESSKCDMVLLGDFNYHHGSWSIKVNGVVTQRITPESKAFAAGVKGLGLALQTTPGEITFSRSQDTDQQRSTIDLTFASRKLAPSVLSCKALQIPGYKSDHRVIETVIRRRVNTHVRIIPQWQEADHEVFQRSLEPLLPSLDALLDTDDQRDKYMTDIMYGLMEAIHDNVPMFTEDKSATTKGAYELAGIAKNIGKPNQISQTPTLRLGDEVAETDSEKIEMIKKEKFPDNDKPYSKSIPTEPRPRPADSRPELCMSQDLDDEHLRLIISKLQRHKAPGPDLIPNEAIQLGGDVLRSRLLRLFRSCLLHSHYPSPFKDSILVMVRKTGRPLADPKSWRPIALLSSFGKILDRIFGDKMLEVLRAHPELLSSHQFGGRSTTEALQYLLTIIYNTWTFHPGDVVTIFGLDMSSAFDSVLRDRLLQNLVDKGFPPWYVTIVRSMLSDRTATMRMPGIVSPSFRSNSGIPQGSPSSSLLFSIFSNPLLEETCTGLQKVEVNGQSHWVYLYAFAFVDDIYLVAVSKSYEINCKGIEKLHSSVQAVAAGLKVVFGPHKYNLMHIIGPQRDQPDTDFRPQIPGFDGSPEPELRILGVKVDQRLSWQCHIDDIVKKVRKRLGYLSIISKRTTGPTLQTMRLYYLTMIRPVITYACGAWFLRQRGGDKGDCSVKYGLNDDQIKQLVSLNKECLTKLSGAVLDTASEMMEKDLFVENIVTVLHSQASQQRVKSLFSYDIRWRFIARDLWKKSRAPAKKKSRKATENKALAQALEDVATGKMPSDKETGLAPTKKTSRKAPRGKKTPYQILDAEARKIYEAAKRGHDDRARASPNPNEVDKAKERWADYKKRSGIIKAWVKNMDTKECEARWKAYVQQRKDKVVSGGRNPKDLRLPVALTEDWGRKNLEYYSGLTRAQSTMLFACRTERIGLRKYLHDCRIPGFEFPTCPCGRSRETVFHLLVECPRLREARIGLFQQVGHNDFTTLLTKDAKVAAEWAISYFDLAMFDSVRKRSSRFPVFPHLISPRPEGFLHTLSASLAARRQTRTSRTSRTAASNNPRRRSAPRASPATTSTSPQTPQATAPSPPPRRNPTRSARTTISYELEPLASNDI
ncbi:uncharacterized protein FSUBG_8030 [Fusarium subglutinans]|uniref:Reverse transcriptase domain-containing protein n=1 Tax=Gibberella subglutinans TaxID=42677 RepID=A0A8H5PRC8_GIBSU|nr:uncharacterized protein FSUBG_8030 [Fusarium subglutinans]KAF5601665.1 hypothetical protein FSUBG_8030 [Fusarium subglutinans]